MAYSIQQSAALDLGRFDRKEKTPAIRALPENPRAARREPVKVPYFKYLLLFGLVFATLAVIVFSYMRMTELTSQNDRLQGQIEKLKGEEKALQAKKEQMYNLASVEEYAKNQMGMVKLDKSTIQYVSLHQAENTVIAQREESAVPRFISGLIRSFNAVVEYLN